ncbi:hypothetical protein AB0I28_10425 [Phytomonospora sp. NPDC050363]|uniref:hypothetical protein n=1 Tax=Phytomonospora sp. NPDC050363 TaxID=3155642 RepID=UPI0033D9558E
MKKFVAVGVLVLAALAAGACNKAPGTVGQPDVGSSGSSAPAPGGSPDDSAFPYPGDSGLPGRPGPGDPSVPADGQLNVVVKLSGLGKAVAVHYGINGQETNLRSADLPWGQQLKATSGQTVTVGGSAPAGELTCQILVNGTQAVADTGPLPQCSYTIP